MQTFTAQQVIDRLSERYRLYNHGSKEELTGGMTMQQHEVIGDLMMALHHESRTGSRVKRSYPKAA